MKKLIFVLCLFFATSAWGIEDFTTYTKSDPGGDFTITSDTITVDTHVNNVKSFVIKDFGAGFFAGDFKFRFQIKKTTTSGGWISPFALTNTQDGLFDIVDVSGDCLFIRFSGTTAPAFQLQEQNNGTITLYNSTETYANNTDYYLELERNEAVGTYGTLYARIYTDAAFTTLSETLTVTLTEKQDFRYLSALNTYYVNDTNEWSGYIKNLTIASISGTLKAKESDVSGSAIDYLVVNRATGAIAANSTSAADGTYSVSVNNFTTEYDVFMIDLTNYLSKVIGEQVTGAY